MSRVIVDALDRVVGEGSRIDVLDRVPTLEATVRCGGTEYVGLKLGSGPSKAPASGSGRTEEFRNAFGDLANPLPEGGQPLVGHSRSRTRQ